MTISVLFDVSILGRGHLDARSRTGIFRVAESLLLELVNLEDINVATISFHGGSSFWDEFSSYMYINEYLNQGERSIPFLRRYEREIPFYHYRTNLQRFLLNDSQKNRSLYRRGMRFLIAKFAKAFDLAVGIESKASRRGVDSEYAIFHSPFFALPNPELFASSTTRILTIHDLIPIKYPQFFTAGIINQFASILASINARKDWIICDSYNTRKDLLEYFNGSLDEHRVFVNHCAASPHFQPVDDAQAIAAIQSQYGIPSEKPYFLSLGAIEPRKNLPFLIKCFSKVVSEHRDLDLNLVLVGPKGWKDKEVFETALNSQELRDRIIFTGFVPDENLSAIYSGALAFVYPSIYEGFGLPPLEAMQCGTPVIASNTSSLPEVLGEAGILIDPQNEDELCQALITVTQDQNLRQDLSSKGLQQAQTFSWAASARRMADIYRQVKY